MIHGDSEIPIVGPSDSYARSPGPKPYPSELLNPKNSFKQKKVPEPPQNSRTKKTKNCR